MTTKRYCSGKVWGGAGDGYCCCNKTGKYEEDGKFWCGIHRPSKAAERRAKRDAEYDARIEESRKRAAELQERERRADLYDELVEALKEVKRYHILDNSQSVAFNKVLAVLAKCEGEQS